MDTNEQQSQPIGEYQAFFQLYQQLNADAEGLQMGGADTRVFVPERQVGDGARGRSFPELRFAQALDAAAFLVNKNGGVRPSDSLSKRRCQRTKLILRFHVAGKQDQAPGIGFPEERDFILGECHSGAAGHKSLSHGPGLNAAP